MNKPFAPRRLVVAVLVGLLCAGVTTFVRDTFHEPVQSSSVTQPLPPVERAPGEQTDLETVKAGLGPFETVNVLANTPNPETYFPAVLILNEDGTTEVSQQWRVPFDVTQWSQQFPPQIREKTVSRGYVYLKANHGNVFVVKANQAFILADEPEFVNVIDDHGVGYATTIDRAILFRQPL